MLTFAGKFLDEERALKDYPLNGPIGFLEVGVDFVTLAIFDIGPMHAWLFKRNISAEVRGPFQCIHAV